MKAVSHDKSCAPGHVDQAPMHRDCRQPERLLKIGTWPVAASKHSVRCRTDAAAGQEHPVATTEILGLHVVGKPPRSAVFPTDIQAKVDALRTEHGAIPWPPVAGLGIALKRRRGP